MKRGEPLKRGKGLVRKTPLEGRTQPLSRSKALGRGNGPVGTSRAQNTSTGLARTARKAKVKIPPKVRAEAKARSRGRCVVCGEPGDQLHHVLPERLFPQHARRAEVLVLVCIPDHDRHESAFRRIRWSELPACTIAFASALDGPELLYLERTYPRA